MKVTQWGSLFLITMLGGGYMALQADATPASDIEKQIKLPQGFQMHVYANLSAYGSPRMMSFDSQGRLFVALPSSHQVLMLSDENHDGLAEPPVVVASDLNAPNSVAIHRDTIYISNQDSIVTVKASNHNTWTKPITLVSGLPSGGHTYKTVRIGPDQHLYVNVGSSCNVCIETNPTRATILRYTLDGQPAGSLTTVGRHRPSAIWASGLRNSQGFAWHPDTGDFYATNEGADNRSETKRGPIDDELPPEHLNIIRGGQHYGWPYCWANPKQTNQMFQDPNFEGERGFCESTTAPAFTFTAHSTPIGITFLNQSQFPLDYHGDAIVALHGSWNRKHPSGYALVRLHFKDQRPAYTSEFASGWLQDASAWGRPVDVTIGTDGAMYVSDDKSNMIYKITYTPSKQ